jgi:ectoine hydroxylase-related dioxygenase (phytanoyl-CoA dioxygenase family)
MWPEVVELVRQSPLAAILLEAFGSDAGVVRGLSFDKPPGQSWALPWHRDRTVAVKAHGKLGVFNKPTTKAGVPHVEAPVELLEQMLTVRIHLDDVAEENGPLRVIPGSHGTKADQTPTPVTLLCRAGDVLLMRPLLLHGSGHSADGTNRHRRIVHLECAGFPTLPDGYEWQHFVRVDG